MDLWRLCFEDTEEFIRFYFSKKYKEENTLVYWDKQGDVIAALQMPLYPITFAGTLVQAGYISGACTHPLAREIVAGGFRRDEETRHSVEHVDPGERSVVRLLLEDGIRHSF